MLVGIPKEIKNEEHRVGLTPFNAHELVRHGHHVMIEHNAGAGIGFYDEHYRQLGVEVVSNASDIYARADMIVKVKEPQANELAMIRAGQVLFTYLHLAPDLQQAEALMKSGCIAIAYETVTDEFGGLPLLTPMSQVAGRLSIQVGAHCLEKSQGGSGILLGGVPGVNPGKVVVIGGGVVGTNAVRMAMGKETQVIVLDKSLRRLQELDFEFGGRLHTLYASTSNLEEQVASADLVIGAVLVPGKAAPRLVSRELIKKMRPGSVLVDVAIDQGGCFETSRATTHSNPTYVEENIVHYCVTNMPGAVPRTSTLALNNATVPFVLDLANKGYRQALLDDYHLLNGLNICQGHVTHPGVAKDLGKVYHAPLDILS